MLLHIYSQIPHPHYIFDLFLSAAPYLKFQPPYSPVSTIILSYNLLLAFIPSDLCLNTLFIPPHTIHSFVHSKNSLHLFNNSNICSLKHLKHCTSSSNFPCILRFILLSFAILIHLIISLLSLIFPQFLSFTHLPKLLYQLS